jgi:hypothetical protein
MSSSEPVISVGLPPYPAGSTESMISTIAKRAQGGKLAIVERGAKNAMIVQMHSKESDIAVCDVIDVPEQE